jgi:hypothetical protein
MDVNGKKIQVFKRGSCTEHFPWQLWSENSEMVRQSKQNKVIMIT